MGNPNKILAKKIYDVLSNQGFISSDIDEATFTTFLETGKMQLKDWESYLVAPDKQNANETTAAAD